MLNTAREIARQAEKQGYRVLVVGGLVRDKVLGLESKDVDCEIYFANLTEIEEFLSQFGEVEINFDARFPIFRLTVNGFGLEFCPPRRDRKVAPGSKGFEITVDPEMTPEEACSRRHFTIGSMALDPLTDEIIDPFGGQADLNNKILRATDERFFADDPLRALIGMQLAGRFNLTATEHTENLAGEMLKEAHLIHSNAKWLEWEKWAAKSATPSKGLEFLRGSGWLQLFPEIQTILGLPQDPRFHPEGNVWQHTLETVDEAAKIADGENLDKENRLVLVFAALCHDLGKATTTTNEDGKITSKRHAKESAKFAESFLLSIGAPSWLIEKVKPLVREHMVLTNAITEKSVRRLANRLQPATITELLQVIESDQNGRGSMPKGLGENGCKLAELAQQQAVENGKPKALLMGRHLLEMMSPGPQMGQLLRAAFEAQLDGVFSNLEGAMSWARRAIG